MPGMPGNPTAPEHQPVVMELMEARTSKKRTRDDEIGGENHNLNVFVPDISKSHLVDASGYRGYSTETSVSSTVTVISPPAATKLCHGSRINLEVRPRFRPALGKKRRVLERKIEELAGPNLHGFASETLSRSTAHSRHLPSHHTDSTQQEHHQQSQKSHTEKSAAKPILTPCHICYRRPTMRSQLDAYADCELCQARTCYICLRECDGPDCRMGTMDTSNNNSHEPNSQGRKMCSWCAVEGVTDSGVDVVWCVDCVQRGEEGCQEDSWMGG